MAQEASTLEIKRTPLGKRLRWGASVGLILRLAAFGVSRWGLLETWEFATLDWRQNVLADRTATVDKVALVMIDANSVAEAEKVEGATYPWPRDFYLPIVLFLKEAGARAIVFDIYFYTPWRIKGHDEPFADALKEAGIVSLAAKLDGTPPGVAPPDPSAFEKVIAKSVVGVQDWRFPPREGINTLVPPILEFVDGARSIGFANVDQDRDNTVRRVDLLYPYPNRQECMASLAFDAFRRAKSLGPDAYLEGRRLRIGDYLIPLGDDGRLLVRFYGPENTFRSYSAISLIRSFVAQQEGKELKDLSVDPALFKDKIVIVGVNAPGEEDIVTAPVSSKLPGAELHATVVANLLGMELLREQGAWMRFAYYLLVGLAAGFLSWGLWKPLPSAIGTVLLAAALTAAACLSFQQGLVLDLFCPVVLSAVVFTSSTVAGYLLEGRKKREVSKAFGQYLSPVVIREVMRNPEALKLGGETREIAVYFSDIAGFSTFSEGMSAQELVSFLNEYLGVMTDIILDHRGVVDKYVGDLIMAFWGAPLAVAAPGREACLAVLEQRKSMALLQQKFLAEGRPPFDFRTGLNMGPATVGNMGSARRFNYTAMGDTVNLASRLEGANKHFGTSVLMTEAVRASAGDAVVARRIGRVQVVGKSMATMVYELIGAPDGLDGAARDRLERYHEALGLLEAGKSAEAAKAFEKLLSSGPDSVIVLCLEKAQELTRTGERWDGVWVLTSKG